MTARVFVMNQSEILANCPNFIIMPGHYPNGTGHPCECFNRENRDMREWGYRWSKKQQRWIA